MPNFLLIGAAKSGTSSLYYYLKQHPQIYMPTSRQQKEPDFFTLEGNGREPIREDILKLQDLINRDLSVWLKV